MSAKSEQLRGKIIYATFIVLLLKEVYLSSLRLRCKCVPTIEFCLITYPSSGNALKNTYVRLVHYFINDDGRSEIQNGLRYLQSEMSNIKMELFSCVL